MDPLQSLVEIAVRYGERLTAALPVMLVLAGAGALLWAGRKRLPRPLAWALLGVAVLAGASLAWGQLSLVDDAFISFRYADNWLEGHGLVWNPGERVEGITNLGWTVLLAWLWAILPLDIEHIALIACGLSWLACVGLVTWLSRELGRDQAWLPLAAGLVAVQYAMTAFASTGLEAAFGTALGLAGALALFRRRPWLASLLWMVATLVRLDHALFWAAGLLWLLGRHGSGALAGVPADRRAVVAYALPLSLLAALLAFKLWFYGDILPNTYYAKAAYAAYVEQGLVYTWATWLGSHLWMVLPLAALWPVLARYEERGLATFAAVLVVGWHAYVIKVGGDFMIGRFTLPVVPWVLLAAERSLVLLSRVSPKLAVAWAGVTLATARGVPMIEPTKEEWYLADENTVYAITQVNPLQIEHHHFRTGQAFRELLTDRGVRFPIASSGIGMVGFYSELEVIDLVGLTDAVVAHQPVRRRGRPGHEKRPPKGYLTERGVKVSRQRPPDEWQPMRRFDLPGTWPGARRHWHLYVYDEALMDRLAEEVPEIRFNRFDGFVRREFLPGLAHKTKAEALEDLEELDRFYWDVNGPDALRDQVVAAIERLPE